MWLLNPHLLREPEMSRRHIPKVTIENVEVDQNSDSLKSIVAVIHYPPGRARIEIESPIEAQCASVGREGAARFELQRLIEALQVWSSSTARFAHPAPQAEIN
jgi:hypothetical protein